MSSDYERLAAREISARYAISGVIVTEAVVAFFIVESPWPLVAAVAGLVAGVWWAVTFNGTCKRVATVEQDEFHKRDREATLDNFRRLNRERAEREKRASEK